METEEKISSLMKLDKVDESIQKQVVLLREPPNNWSYPKISEWLMNSHNVKCSHLAVQNWVERRKHAIVKSIYGDKIFLKRAQEEYGKILGEYFRSMYQLTNLLRQVCRSREDLSKKTEMATSLMGVIRECLVSAKDVVVGNTSVDRQVVDLEEDIRRMVEDVGYQMPVLQVIDGKVKEKEEGEES